MTGRDVVNCAFELKEAPRLPATLIAGGSWALHLAGETFAGVKNNPERIADINVQAFRKAKSDILFLASFGNYPIHLLGCPIIDNSSEAPTLIGSVIQSLDEIDTLDVEKVLNNQTMQGIIHAHHLAAGAAGKEMCVMASQFGPFTCSAKIFGVESSMVATMQNADNLLKLIRFGTDFVWSYIEPMLDHEDVSGVFLGEPVGSGDLISPNQFRTFVAPALKDIVGRIQSKGKYAMVHICGNTSQILEDIVDIDPDCFSLDSKVDLRKAKEVLGGRVCVAGNVSPTGIFLSGTPEGVIKEGKACVEAWGEGGGYVLALGCDFPKDVPFENIKALMSLKEK